MKKWLKRIVLGVLALLLLALGTGWWLMRGSLPELDGELALAGLSAPVTVQRDANGTVTIDAANETDALRALGYVHAQERYFEMDLMRRMSAGELSELFGAIAIDTDKRQRAHRIRARVEANLDGILDGTRPQAQAYVDGVNAGLSALSVRPWPYLLLRQQPRPWTLPGHRLRDVLRPAGRQQSQRTGDVADAAAPAAGAVRVAAHRRQPLGRAADGRGTWRCAPARPG